MNLGVTCIMQDWSAAPSAHPLPRGGTDFTGSASKVRAIASRTLVACSYYFTLSNQISRVYLASVV